MILTEQQQDALAELINIAFSRTAASLSDLTSQRVLLDAPQVDLRPLNELSNLLAPNVQNDDVATVHQPFAGPVTGDAFLLLSYSDALTLTNLLTDARIKTSRLDTSAREVLTEVGNILLNACLACSATCCRCISHLRCRACIYRRCTRCLTHW
jgi:chemotaxis protein CheC